MGAAYALPLAAGDRVRLFARTNAAYADHSRGIIGNNGSVLTVRGINATGVVLKNAQGREGLVKWDTLREPNVGGAPTSGRIRLSYGDVLTIDAAQGLTSTEHIQAMPAGTQAVTAYKAYTAASRHRRASYMIVSDGAERREIAARRPLGDPRPIQEADVWANMARNLARQPERPAALDFLERAHSVRRGAVHALQAGLQPAEQRAADGLAKTTLPRTWQRRRLVARVAEMAERLGTWADEQSLVLHGLARLAPNLQDAVAQSAARLRPAIHGAATRIRQRAAEAAAFAELSAQIRRAWGADGPVELCWTDGMLDPASRLIGELSWGGLRFEPQRIGAERRHAVAVEDLTRVCMRLPPAARADFIDLVASAGRDSLTWTRRPRHILKPAASAASHRSESGIARVAAMEALREPGVLPLLSKDRQKALFLTGLPAREGDSGDPFAALWDTLALARVRTQRWPQPGGLMGVSVDIHDLTTALAHQAKDVKEQWVRDLRHATTYTLNNRDRWLAARQQQSTPTSDSPRTGQSGNPVQASADKGDSVRKPLKPATTLGASADAKAQRERQPTPPMPASRPSGATQSPALRPPRPLGVGPAPPRTTVVRKRETDSDRGR
jgi:hypothetical protein